MLGQAVELVQGSAVRAQAGAGGPSVPVIILDLGSVLTITISMLAGRAVPLYVLVSRR